MEVTVNMSAEEFLEFMAWQRTETTTTRKWPRRIESGKCWQIKPAGPSRKTQNGPERSRSWIRNTRRSCWSWQMTTYHKKKTTCARC